MPSAPHSHLYSELRRLLREARRAASLSQEAVAKRLGKPQSFVAKYEAGDRNLDVVEFLKVCDALGVDARTILDSLLSPTVETVISGVRVNNSDGS